MEIKELREKTEKDLHKLLAASREKLRSLRFSVSAKQLKNLNQIKQVKVLIARIMTTLKEKKSTDKPVETDK